MLSSVGSLRPSVSIDQSATVNLQSTIDANQIVNAIALLKNHNLLNSPLPNGHMPLNYAIRHGKLELVEAMLKELKLETQDKDFQGLTAIDHALITQDAKMIALVIGNTIGQAFDAAATKNLSPNEVLEVWQIVNAVQQVRSSVVSSNPLHEAARKGNLDEVKKLYNRLAPNSYDQKGLSPLHYAALSGKKEIVEWLLQNGERADILTKTGHSALLFACIGGHSDLISYFVQTQNANPNAVDPKGRTFLHYAIALEDFSAVKALIQNGANPFLRITGGNTTFSPIEMMLFLAKERSNSRDPLALTPLEIYMFVGIVAPWVSQICGVDSPLLEEILPIIGKVSTFFSVYNSLKSSKAVALFWASQIGTSLAAATLMNQIFYTGDTTGARGLLGFMGVQLAWTTYQLGKNVLKGLGNAWGNRSLETYRPIRNAIVHSVIGMEIAKLTTSALRTGMEYKTALDAWDKYMETGGDKFRSMGDAKREECFNDYFGRFFGSFNNGPCYVDPNICEGKSEVECILNLNPEIEGPFGKIPCKNQAQMILALSGQDRCKKAFRKLSVKYHPDKINNFLGNVPDNLRDIVLNNTGSVYNKIKESAEIVGCA